jgi:hypothetical protein
MYPSFFFGYVFGKEESVLKKTTVILVLTAFLLSMICPMASIAQQSVKVYVNGMKLDIYPRMEEGSAYLPAQTLAQSLGVSINWDSATRIVKINNNVISTSPLMVDGKLYLPVESIASGAGASVEWDGSAGAIRISKSGSSSAVAAAPSAPVVKSTPVAKPSPAYTPAAPANNSSGSSSGKNPRQSPNIPLDPTLVKAPDVSVSYQPSPTLDKPATGKNPPGGLSHKPPSSYSGQPSKSAYPDAQKNDSPIRPKDAPPAMPSNLSLPSLYATGDISSPGPAGLASNSPFVPRSESNGVFRVSVTNVEVVDSIKDYYKPKPGYKFVIVYLSQQNISEEVQIYTGRFSVLDQDSRSYDYIEGLSNYWLVILRPGGINFGYLVFEVPSDAKPMSTVLHGLNQSPLTVGLR